MEPGEAMYVADAPLPPSIAIKIAAADEHMYRAYCIDVILHAIFEDETPTPFTLN